MRFKKKITTFIAVLFLISSTVYFFHYFPRLPLSFEKTVVTFVLPHGASLKFMLKQMRAQGVLNKFQMYLLRIWIPYQGMTTKLKAGEYAIPLNTSPRDLLNQITKGEVIQHTITLVEGITFEEALKLITAHPAVKKTLTTTSPTDIMELLGEPGLTAEGLFFPDTYYFTLNMSDLALLRRARQTMQEKLNLAWENRDPDIVIKTPYEALILASIIEKETGLASERSLISGVFQRRLQKNMRLQADPTVIYGIKETFLGNLTREHLKQDTPFNTYLHTGLPPTPIALPSLKSIEAALHPDKSDALYFVAKGDGSHLFSSTLPEHNQAVDQYQITPAQGKQTP